ncbi:MAG: PH domain-containing protein [Patescibacteria group bacterium]|nr:PH domain-containing protein [Patescibacteria group bacterium]
MFHLDKLPGALPDEKIIGLYRRHPITILGLIIVFCIFIILPLAAYLSLKIFGQTYFQNQQLMALFVMGGGLFFLFVVMFLYQHFIDYWLDMWIVTDQRIINIEQNGLFSRTTSELRLYRVQDVTAKVDGFVRSMLDFGMVYVQTAGEKEYFTFEDVSHPNQISKKILELAELDRKEHLEEAMEAAAETTVEKEDELREKTARRLEP